MTTSGPNANDAQRISNAKDRTLSYFGYKAAMIMNLNHLRRKERLCYYTVSVKLRPQRFATLTACQMTGCRPLAESLMSTRCLSRLTKQKESRRFVQITESDRSLPSLQVMPSQTQVNACYVAYLSTMEKPLLKPAYVVRILIAQFQFI